jgi:hypothetical protein
MKMCFQLLLHFANAVVQVWPQPLSIHRDMLLYMDSKFLRNHSNTRFPPLAQVLALADWAELKEVAFVAAPAQS